MMGTLGKVVCGQTCRVPNTSKSDSLGLRKGDKSVIQRKLLFKFYNNGFISTSNSEQEEQTEQNMSFIAVYHKFTEILKKYEKPHHNDCLNVPTLCLGLDRTLWILQEKVLLSHWNN